LSSLFSFMLIRLQEPQGRVGGLTGKPSCCLYSRSSQAVCYCCSRCAVPQRARFRFSSFVCLCLCSPLAYCHSQRHSSCPWSVRYNLPPEILCASRPPVIFLLTRS
jgi:hypothetical protein